MASTRRLPAPLVEVWDWQSQGSCRNLDNSVFFHPDGERGAARTKRERRAKAICADCPVIRDCRRHALTAEEPYGIWGGMGETERREALKRARP